MPAGDESPNQRSRFFARAGGGVDHHGSPLVALGAQLYGTRFWNLGLDGVFAVVPGRVKDSGFALESTTHSLFLASAFSSARYDRMSLAVGPVLGVHVQRVTLVDPASTPDGDPVRWLPSLGAQAALRVDASNRIRIDLVQRGVLRLLGTRFVIADVHGAQREVLDVPHFAWDLSLNVGAWL
jgi:hypothetical protein